MHLQTAGRTTRWQVAFAQHPMYLIIRECASCAERTPPWGEPTIELYVDRVRRNLAALRAHPELKLGYEWSGLELEQLAADAPDVLVELRALAADGRIAFYNGTYAQPHLQTLSSEANLRQFEHGARALHELCGWQVRTYAHQEASVHDQLPQLLRAFGFRFAVVPRFASTLTWLEGGELLLFDLEGPRFVHGQELIAWRGLDGTEIPLYLHTPRIGRVEDWVARESMAGRLHAPPLIVSIPDLQETGEEWVERHRGVELVLLDEALEARARASAPRGRARFHSSWSYIEGIRAEELSRADWRAEAAALRAEALGALALALLDRPPEPTDSIWRTILAAQHHDVHCFCAPGLRRKAIRRLRQAERIGDGLAERAAQAVAGQVDCSAGAGTPVIVFAVIPEPHTAVVAFDVAAPVTVTTDRGEVVPAECAPGADGSTHVQFLTRLGGAGYATFWLRPASEAGPATPSEGPITFENRFFRVSIEPDGTFGSLTLLPSGDELLAVGATRGNLLTATDSDGVGPRREGQGERDDWQPPEPPRPLPWSQSGPAHIRRSALGLCVTTAGSLGSAVQAALTVRLYRELPRIDMEWAFTFRRASVGTFYDDDSKLCVHWPLAVDGSIAHDIPFGVVEAHPDWPCFPVSWLDVSDGARGLAYFHRGTPKHWVRRGTLTNLLAWGQDTEAIGSRMWRHNWPKAFDQRLRGRHAIQCAVYPHSGDWRRAGVAAMARAYGAGPLACVTEPHAGRLASRAELLALQAPDVVSTALTVRGRDVLCRVHSVGVEPSAVGVRPDGLRVRELRSLGGDRLQRLAPFQIGELVLERRT